MIIAVRCWERARCCVFTFLAKRPLGRATVLGVATVLVPILIGKLLDQITSGDVYVWQKLLISETFYGLIAMAILLILFHRAIHKEELEVSTEDQAKAESQIYDSDF